MSRSCSACCCSSPGRRISARRALAWWGSAHLLRAVSIMLFGMHGSIPNWISIDVANAVAVRLVRADLERRAGVRPPQRPSRSGAWSASSSGCWPAGCRSSPRRSELRAMVGAADRHDLHVARGLTNSGATATRRWCRAGPRSSCCSRTARCSCCARRSARCFTSRPTVITRRARWLELAEPRGAAVHHLDRLHPAGDGQGAHRVRSPRRGAHRFAHRHRQPARLPRADAYRRSAGRWTSGRPR